MSKGLSYFIGIVTGVLLTLCFFAVKDYSIKESKGGSSKVEKKAKLPKGVTFLDEPIPFTGARNFRILQVVFNNGALAESEETVAYGSPRYSEPIVLIVSSTENSFYDDQIVKAPKGSKVLQVGTYNYKTGIGWKTVPIIRFSNTE